MANGKSGYWRTPEGLLLIEGWARDGLTEDQIAHNMGIARSTLNEWKAKFPDISDALKKGKEVVDRAVENALLKRALGYDYTEERIENSQIYGIKTIRITKHVPADTTAQIFWLKNRKPEQYRERRDAVPERDGSDTGVLMMPEVMRPE